MDAKSFKQAFQMHWDISITGAYAGYAGTNQHITQCIANPPQRKQCTVRSVLTAMCTALLMMGKTQQLKPRGRRHKAETWCCDATCFLIHEVLRE